MKNSAYELDVLPLGLEPASTDDLQVEGGGLDAGTFILIVGVAYTVGKYFGEKYYENNLAPPEIPAS